uniref:Carbonyl reductase (NADPH) n=1 Tax=Oryctolagus cuniculus TaxID=9986 RepID=G1TCA8_RABIT
MSSCSRVALVTGANKGVGFAITRDLCRLFSGDVVLTARDEARGRAAVQQLQAEGLSPRFHQLDITDLQSIRALRDFLRREYGGLNVLVNNAAIAFQTDDPTPFDIQAELTVKTNFFATRNICTELLPIMKPHGRVVNISSLQGLQALENCSEDLQEKFRCETLTEGDLVDLMNKFVEDTKNEVHEKEGWPHSAYGVSKLGVTVLSRILARRLEEKRKADRILLNACCLGWVEADMAGDHSSRTVEEGAETPVYLALLPPDATEPQGQLVCDKIVQSWSVHWNPWRYLELNDSARP